MMTMILVLVSNWAVAQELGVTITQISGECQVMRAGEVKWIKVEEPAMRLYLNDRIRTKLISKATLIFDDGTIIEMKENTTIDIKKLFEDKLTTVTKSEMKIWLGEIVGTIEKLKTKDSEFNIYTPVAIIGIRGTKINVKVGSKGETTCYVRQGSVRMCGIKEPEDKWTIIEENNYSTSITGEEVSPPKKFKPLPLEEKEEVKPLLDILKKKKEGILLPEEELPAQFVGVAPKVTAEFPEQGKPFINHIPNVTVFLSPPPMEKISICFLQIGDDKPIELPKGVTKYRFKPYLKPGPNELVVKAWYEGGLVGKTVIRFPFFDPHPPRIQSMKYIVLSVKGLDKEIASTQEQERYFPVEISVIVSDLGSGVGDVIINGRRMEKIREGYYKKLLFLSAKMSFTEDQRVVKKVEDVKLEVIDKAQNSITQIIDSTRIAKDIKRRLETGIVRPWR